MESTFVVYWTALKVKSPTLSNGVEVDKTDRRRLAWGYTVCIYTFISQYSE